MTSKTRDGESLREQVAEDGAQGKLLARMDERLVHVISDGEKRNVKLDKVVEDVGHIKVAQSACAATQAAKWEEQGRVNDDLRQKKNIGDAVAYAGVIGATVLSALGFKAGT